MAATDDSDRRKKEEAEGQTKKLPYPKSVYFIVGNEFCERFSYYGMKAILSIYLKDKLHFTENKATVIYHTFSMFCYFTPIFGAMLADMFLGKFKTIVYISLIYVLGHLLKTLAAVPTLGVPPVEFSLIGLALIAVGTGGIKPCVSAFGGDQFKLPEQARQLQTFFSVFYFAINAGSLISTILTPAIREDVECFGDDTCYSLAFGIPAVLMLIATIVIIVGKPLYSMKPPQGNILPKVFGSLFFAIKEKLGGEKAEHFMDLAKSKYDVQLVEDVKCLLRVLVIYLPLPVWWALFDQTGSRWTFQATRMNGELGSTTIKPDQMQVINPLLILFLIPIFDRIVYPLFAKCGLLVKPLQRMTAGGLLTAMAFIISGFLELEMMKTYAKIPTPSEAHINAINSLPCFVDVKLMRSGHVQQFMVPPHSSFVKFEINPEEYTAFVETNTTCLPGLLTQPKAQTQITATGGKVSSLLITASGGAVVPRALSMHEDPNKDDGSNGRFSVIHDLGPVTEDNTVHLSGSKSYNVTIKKGDAVSQSEYSKIEIGSYNVSLGSAHLGEIQVNQGGVYQVLVAKDPETNIMTVSQFVLTVPNKIHILWLFPQYFVITVGEIMFSITGLEFSYSQAPESMKSVLQAAWLLTVAFGNIIVIIVAEAKAFNQAGEFFMFAGLMIVDMFLFAWLAWRYIPRESRDKDMKMEVTGVPNSNFQSD